MTTSCKTSQKLQPSVVYHGEKTCKTQPRHILAQKGKAGTVTDPGFGASLSIGVFGIHCFLKFRYAGRAAKDSSPKISLNNNSKGLVRFMKMVIFAHSFGSTTNLIGCILQPDSPRLLTSLSESPLELPFLYKALAGFVHFYMSFFHYYTTTFYAALIFCYINALLPVISSMKVQRSENKDIKVLHRVYNSLAVLTNHFNGTFSMWPLATEHTNGLGKFINYPRKS
ncbi:unnamed protein product [Allacma fusca]|uniref:Uncharacterized protein n=1 Tax=Allacma fusca TaxID=39272 RepID=A0A8J2KSV3_9HEXA|nr:unnamed protein product [Allacma fusca]